MSASVSLRRNAAPAALVLALVAGAAVVAPGSAPATTPLAITSNDSLGAVVWSGSGGLNTDNGGVYYTSNTGDLVFSGYAPSTVVQQADGSSVRVFNYSSLTINAGVSVTLFGSLPAVLASSGDITINGAVVVQSDRRAAGGDTQSAPGATGGKVGSGAGAWVGSPCCGYDVGSGGGGGGKGSAGGQGNAGSLFPSGAANGVGGLGGAKDPTPLILSGGGGGGGGVYGTNYFNYAQGANGGLGGGAALFVTPDNITIGASGSVSADGARGGDANYAPGGNAGTGGGGGGGAGGAIWFDAGGAWTNYGTVSVQGGGPGYPVGWNPAYSTPASVGGVGAGGTVVIDPTAIYNYGQINLSDGGGGAGAGGTLDLSAPTIVNTGAIIGEAAAAPEPAAWTLAIAGLGLVGLTQRRRRAGARDAIG